MDYTKSKGNITELTCLMGFMSMGFDCSIPYGDCARYDMIVDTGDELLKVQCKSSSNPIIANMDNYSVRENRVVLIRTIINTIIYSFTKQLSNQLNNQLNNF